MKRLRNILPVALLCMLALSCRNTASDTDRRIERLLAGMTLQEKVGQMAQLTIEPFVIADGSTWWPTAWTACCAKPWSNTASVRC